MLPPTRAGIDRLIGASRRVASLRGPSRASVSTCPCPSSFFLRSFHFFSVSWAEIARSNTRSVDLSDYRSSICAGSCHADVPCSHSVSCRLSHPPSRTIEPVLFLVQQPTRSGWSICVNSFAYLSNHLTDTLGTVTCETPHF